MVITKLLAGNMSNGTWSSHNTFHLVNSDGDVVYYLYIGKQRRTCKRELSRVPGEKVPIFLKQGLTHQITQPFTSLMGV